jgi:pimeloyl-ACP methyl ester carboxylesterase
VLREYIWRTAYTAGVPIVLVHGVPETDAVWDEFRAHLAGRESITLSPPGFGAPVPEGFGATSDDYLAWLTAELQRIEGPIDLLGHDWGGGHVFRTVAASPELVRSWATDLAGCFDPRYVWHENAQTWQTPGAGEALIARRLATSPADRAPGYVARGMSESAAAHCMEAFDESMGRCILALYRSAAQPKMAAWGANVAGLRSRPGLVIVPAEDSYTGGEALARRTAERADAQVALLTGLGHWWMCQDPQQAAAAYCSFIAAVS